MLRALLSDLFSKPSTPKGLRRKGAKRGRSHGRQTGFEPLEERAMMTFLLPSTSAVGASPAGIAVGDFSDDGKADMAVVDQSSSSINLLISRGDGTFDSSGSYSAGAAAIDAAFGDFNSDGKNDVAVVSTNGTVNVLLGRGVLTAADYTLWRDHQGSTVPAGTLGDQDGNGLVDDADYTLLKQQFGKPPVSGAFTAPTTYAVGLGSHSMNVGDFNDDGKLDVATMNSGTASLLLGNGDGTFQPRRDAAIPGNSTNTVVGDFDRDGHLDLATSNTASNGTITILRGHGDGSFDPSSSVYAFSAPVYLGAGDFNHDGYDDFAVANSYVASSMSVVMNNGDGTYSAPHTYDIPETGYEIQVEDFDHDGNDDFAVHGASHYMVHHGNGDGTFLPSVSYSIPAGRFEMGTHGDFNGDGAVDFAYPSSNGVTVMMNANDTVTNLAGAVGFNVTVPESTTSGSSLPMTITVVDADGNQVPDFQGTVYITSNDAASNTTFAYRFTSADAGVHTFTSSVRLVTLGAQTVTISAPLMSATTKSVNVTPAVARFNVSAPAATTAGDLFEVTVSAIDSLGSVGSGYTSTVHFSSADQLAGLPADYTFTTADAGVHTFTMTLKSSGNRYVNVNEVGRNNVNGGVTVNVNSAAVASLGLAGASGAIGIARPITIVGRDSYGNIATDYSGTVHITSSDSAAVLPADVTLARGTATFNATFLTVGTQTITATDVATPELTATLSSDATPPVPALFDVAGYPSTTAGLANTFTITVRDTIGQVATGYSGTVYFSSSDIQAGLPASYTFTEADAGVHAFTAVLRTAGTQSLSALDISGALVGSQLGIDVSPSAMTGYKLSVPLGADSKGHMLVTAGQSIPLTVKATDGFGNIVTNYSGTIHLTSTDAQALAPGDYTFTAADAGIHTFAVELRSVTPKDTVWSFTAVDTTSAATVATITNFEVNNAAASVFVLSIPSRVTAGRPYSLKVSVLDAFGNRAKNYYGTLHLTSTTGGTELPLDYAFTPDDAGDHTFDLLTNVVGNQSITVTDAFDATITSTISFNVRS